MLRSLNGVPRRANPTLQGPAKVLEPDRLRRAREAERLVTIPPDPGRALISVCARRGGGLASGAPSEVGARLAGGLAQWMSGQNGQ